MHQGVLPEKSLRIGFVGCLGLNITTIQASILPQKITPFEVVYGRPPPNLLSYVPRTTKSVEVDEVLCARDGALELLRTNLVVAYNA